MLEATLLILLGLAVGGFGTLVGTGGGFLLVPVLLFAYPEKDLATVTAMSLFVVLANTTSGAIAYGYQQRIDYRSAGWFVLATLPGVFAGALLVGLIPRRVFVLLFAVMLAALGAHLIFRRRFSGFREPVRGRGTALRRIRDRSGQRFIYAFRLWQGMTIAGGMGFMSALLGAGGGVVQVPLMTTILHFPVHIAAATSQFLYMIIALEATMVHVSTGGLGWDRELGQASLIALGAVGGAQLGARLALRTRGEVILRALASALILVALWLTLEGLRF